MEFVMIIFWVGMACGFVSGVIAQRKGIGSCAGFFAGFLLGPIGILIVALMADRSK